MRLRKLFPAMRSSYLLERIGMNIQVINITEICNINFLDLTITIEVEVNDLLT